MISKSELIDFNNILLSENCDNLTILEYIEKFLQNNGYIFLYDLFRYINKLVEDTSDDYIVSEDMFVLYDFISNKSEIKNILYKLDKMDYIQINFIYFFKPSVFLINNSKKNFLNYELFIYFYSEYVKNVK